MKTELTDPTIDDIPVWSSKMPLDQQADLGDKHFFMRSIDLGDLRPENEFLDQVHGAEAADDWEPTLIAVDFGFCPAFHQLARSTANSLGETQHEIDFSLAVFAARIYHAGVLAGRSGRPAFRDDTDFAR